MKKIKRLWLAGLKYWQERTKRWRIIFLGGCLLAVILIYLFLSLASIRKTELILARLHRSIGGACHEECRLARAAWRAELAKLIKAGDERLEERISRYFLDPQESLEFKEELLRINQAVYSIADLPSYLKDYRQIDNFSPDLQVLIFNYFFAKSEAQPADLNYYFELLSGTADLKLKQAAVLAIGNINDSVAYFNVSQLEMIQRLLQSAEIEAGLAHSLILLLGDYYRFFPAETDSLLLAAYNSTALDKISRFLAADILNRYRLVDELTLPAVSEAEWENYSLN